MKSRKLFVIFLLLYLYICNNVYAEDGLSSKDLNLETIEIADTIYKQMLGLMHREKLCDKCAMLFVYTYPVKQSFWMKNTKISLDIIFIDNMGKILAIHEKAEPLNTSKRYSADSSYYYVLEANAGFARKNNLSPGKVLNISEILLKANPKNLK